jgi:tripartite-type tricarboxylate transporter receptor subunit TctC
LKIVLGHRFEYIISRRRNIVLERRSLFVSIEHSYGSRMKRIIIAYRGIIAAMVLVSVQANAADWPTKPVRIVVPFTAGGAADTLGRLYSDALSTAFGKQFYVDNRVGAGGLIGAAAVARAEPDGNTLLVSGIPVLVLGPAMNKNIGFDPMRDFTHIGYFGGTPNVLVVHPALNVNTYKDFLALARSVDETQYVSAGFGTVGNWVAEYLAVNESIRLTHVAYKGGPQAILDLLAGHVKVGMLTWSSVADHIRLGRLIPLAVSSDSRLPNLANLPTLRELGHTDFVATAWYSLSGPAGLPEDIVHRLNRELLAATDRPQLRRQIEQDAIDSKFMTPFEVTEFIQSEIDRWQPLIKRVLDAK